MSTNDSPKSPAKIRRDGWTPERQLRFLAALARTPSITKAAAYAGMSRESAYRLRARKDGALFAAAWDHALESHRRVNLDRPSRAASRSKYRGNPAKVTKWMKRKRPGLRSLGTLRP